MSRSMITSSCIAFAKAIEDLMPKVFEIQEARHLAFFCRWGKEGAEPLGSTLLPVAKSDLACGVVRLSPESGEFTLDIRAIGGSARLAPQRLLRSYNLREVPATPVAQWRPVNEADPPRLLAPIGGKIGIFNTPEGGVVSVGGQDVLRVRSGVHSWALRNRHGRETKAGDLLAIAVVGEVEVPVVDRYQNPVLDDPRLRGAVEADNPLLLALVVKAMSRLLEEPTDDFSKEWPSVMKELNSIQLQKTIDFLVDVPGQIPQPLAATALEILSDRESGLFPSSEGMTKGASGWLFAEPSCQTLVGVWRTAEYALPLTGYPEVNSAAELIRLAPNELGPLLEVALATSMEHVGSGRYAAPIEMLPIGGKVKLNDWVSFVSLEKNNFVTRPMVTEWNSFVSASGFELDVTAAAEDVGEVESSAPSEHRQHRDKPVHR